MDVSIAKAAPIHYLKVAILPKKKTIFAPIVTKPILVPNAPNVTLLWRVKWSRHWAKPIIRPVSNVPVVKNLFQPGKG